jgi:hypothetical protein
MIATQITNAIIAVLRLKVCLSTYGLTEAVGRKLGLDEGDWMKFAFKCRVYRAAKELQEDEVLASAKTYNGKVYERYWRINRTR